MKTFRLYVTAQLDVRANSLQEAMQKVNQLQGARKLVTIDHTTDDVMLLGSENIEDALATYGEDAFVK